MFSRQTGGTRWRWGGREGEGGNAPLLNGVVELEGVAVPRRHGVVRHVGGCGGDDEVWVCFGGADG